MMWNSIYQEICNIYQLLKPVVINCFVCYILLVDCYNKLIASPYYQFVNYLQGKVYWYWLFTYPEFETYLSLITTKQSEYKLGACLILCMKCSTTWHYLDGSFLPSLYLIYAHIPLPVIHKCKHAKSTIFCTMKWEFHFTFQ